MKDTYQPNRNLLSATSVTTASTLISGGASTLAVTPGRRLLSFPCDDIASVLYVLPWKAGVAAPNATQIQNGGKKYTSSDRMVELALNEFSDIYACTDSGIFAVYETEWM